MLFSFLSPAFRPQGLRVLVLLLSLLFPAWPAWAVDVNQAQQGQLLQIKGIGPKTAELIIQERERAGPFRSFNDLGERVKGIGPKKLEQMRASGLTLSEPEAGQTLAAPAAAKGAVIPAVRRKP